MASSRRIIIWIAFIVSITSFWLVVLGAVARAEKSTTVEATVVLSGPPTAMLPAGDDEAHVVGLGRKMGTAIFSDGQSAEYSNVFFIDLYRGQGATINGYSKMLFKDGSWFFIKWTSASAGRDEAGNALLQGNGAILKGTGRYTGIKGTATFSNRQLPPDKDHPEGAREAKALFSYTVP